MGATELCGYMANRRLASKGLASHSKADLGGKSWNESLSPLRFLVRHSGVPWRLIRHANPKPIPKNLRCGP